MRHKICLVILGAALMTAGPGYAELLLVEDFSSQASGVTIDGKVPDGVLGGTWDTEGENTGNITTRTENGSMTLRITSHSSGTLYRGAGLTGLSNPIENTEAGVLFFRFKAAAGTTPLGDYLGLHTLTGSSFLTTTTCRAAYVNAGFGLSCPAGSETFDVTTTDNATVLMSGLARDQWYNVWIVADNATDTFDLYISTAENPGGDVGLPVSADLVGENIPFGTQTSEPLVGAMFIKPVFSPAIVSGNVFIDDIYWDGDQGLTLTTEKARNPVPAHRAMQVPVGQTLSWDAPNDPNIVEIFGYDVYLDPNQTNVAMGKSSVRVSADQAAVVYDPPINLQFNRQYFWRVDSKIKLDDPNHTERTVAGDVWTFTCESSAPAFTQQPAGAIVNAGETVSFSVAVDSYFPPSYQWYKSADPANNTPADDVMVSGAVSATLTLSSVSVADEGFYYCKATNPTAAYSDAAGLGIKRTMAHWTLDGLVNGRYEDSSGEGHHADPNGTPVFVGGAYPAATNNGVVVNVSNGWANAGTWDPSQYTGQLTLSVWVKWAGQPATPDYQGIIGKRNVWATDMMWQLEIDNDPVSATAPILAFKSNINGITVSPLPIGEWVQVIVSYDGTTATLYRNGTAEVSGPVAFNTGVSANMMIGAVGQDPALAAPTAPFNGVLDDIQIYNYAINAVQAAYMYSDISGESVCVSPNNPVLQTYDFDGNCKVDVGDLVELASHWLYDQLVP